MFVPVQVVVYSNAQVFGRRYSNLKKETQLGKFELSPVRKEGLNSKSLKIFDDRVKPRHLRHVKEQ